MMETQNLLVALIGGGFAGKMARDTGVGVFGSWLATWAAFWLFFVYGAA